MSELDIESKLGLQDILEASKTYNPSDEKWDVYDINREKTGRLHRRGDKMQEKDYHLVVHVCIFNSKNEMLLQKRQVFKKGWPNLWDITVGGSAVAGDDSRTAAAREVLEEIGLELDFANLRPHFTMNFTDGFDDFYLIDMDVDITKLKLQKEEVSEVKWASLEEVKAMTEDGTMAPYWFIDKLFEIRKGYDGSLIRTDNPVYINATEKNLASWMNTLEVIREGGFDGAVERINNDIYDIDKVGRTDYVKSVTDAIHNNCVKCALIGKRVVGAVILGDDVANASKQIQYLMIHPSFANKGIEETLSNL